MPPDAPSTTSSDPRDRLDDMLSGRIDRADIDVRTFLLDPPPTDEDIARIDRRRMLVRRGSVAVAAIVAILLVAPWPSGGADRDPRATSGEPAEAALAEPVSDAEPRAVRLDLEPEPRPPARATPGTRDPAGSAPPARRRHATTSQRTAATAHPAPSTAPASRPAPSAHVAATPHVEPARPSTPVPAPLDNTGDAIRAPIL